MKSMSKGEVLTVGLMMFSIFFGAGNLIFPPALGQAAGSQSIIAMLGFLVTGVGLPLLGITAIAMQGGKYVEFMNRKTYPWLATALLVILYLTIGPVFAVPRTGAVSFEIGIRPFLSADDLTMGQFIYTLFFFGATYYLAMTPNKLIDRVGKMLTPALLVFLVILFAKSFITPLGEVLDATGAYITAPFSQGFQDGYQTMDLLASLSIGTIVVNAIRMRGTTDNKTVSKICIASGVITVVLMTMVYGSLAYIGATSAGVLGHVENGGQLLAGAVSIFFGPAGNLLVAIIIALACLTTSCGMISGMAWYFNKLTNGRISYARLVQVSTLFSFVASNVGLTQIISLSVPFLVAIYPLVIVFVVLSLFDGIIAWRYSVYRMAINVTLVFAVLDGLAAAGIKFPALTAVLSQYVPFYDIGMGWFVPALLAAALGWLIAEVRGAKENEALTAE
ncbi:branched-chain amino acid:cation transporter, LIVCS family [Selenomonas ruminantium]|uniref:Branched-chain amino acid transport system carrier protein n=1 Tax=Selenomonas ruminantium TaxID=971 RepID=A0A1M6T699_SELRU|nr:branched-chain amino acid transport system II carrier protein [Selenomonas ruminantium]SHK52470.1 branched-chain amino acid:cation transporter, LIVCS family [Selenomonas ruminantium]